MIRTRRIRTKMIKKKKTDVATVHNDHLVTITRCERAVVGGWVF